MTSPKERSPRRAAALCLTILAGAGAAWMVWGRGESTTSAVTAAAEANQPSSPSRSSRRDEARPPEAHARAAQQAAPAAGDQKKEPAVVLSASWGSGPKDLGRSLPSEGAPEGPMSFVVGKNGELFVLDQVNRRIQVFVPGQEPRSIPLEKSTYQDIEMRPDGSIVLLDRLVSQSITILDPSGKVLSEVPVVGPAIEEGGSVTAMFARDDGLWVEVRDQEMVRVADASGRPDPARPRVAGRLSSSGAVLRASLSPEGAVITTEDPGSGGATTAARVLATLPFAMPAVAITALESAPSGIIAVGVLQMREGPAPNFGVAEEAHTLVVLGKDGREIGRAPLAIPAGLEQFRPIRMVADGSIYQLGCGEAGAAITKVTL